MNTVVLFGGFERRRTGDADNLREQGTSRGFGVGVLSGTVSHENGPLRRWVHLFLEEHWRRPGNLEKVPHHHLGSVRSDPVTGAFEFRELDPNRWYTILAYDYTGTYDPVMISGVSPGAPMEIVFETTPIIGNFGDPTPSFPVFNLVSPRNAHMTPNAAPRGFGQGRLQVNVAQDGGPLRRWVHLYVEDLPRKPGNLELVSRHHIGAVRSHPDTGNCQFLNLDEGATFTVVAYDASGQYDPVIKAGLIPEPM